MHLNYFCIKLIGNQFLQNNIHIKIKIIKYNTYSHINIKNNIQLLVILHRTQGYGVDL